MGRATKNKKKKYIRASSAYFIFAILNTIAILIILVSISSGLSRKYILDNLKHDNILEVENYALKVKAEIKHNVEIIKNLIAISEQYQSIEEAKRREYYKNLIISVLKTNSQIKNIFLIWKPYTIDNLDNKYRNLFLGNTGQFAIKYTKKPEIDSSAITTDDLSLLNKYEKEFIAQGQNILVISPLITNRISEGKQFYTRIVGAIKDQQANIIALVGIDIPNDLLINLFPPNLLQHIYILNEDFNFIYHPDKKHIGQNIKAFYPEFLQSELYYDLLKNNPFFGKSKITKEKGYFVAYPVKITNKFWTIIKFIPRSALKPYKAAYFNVRKVVILAIFLYMLIYIIGTLILLRKYNETIKTVINSLFENRPITIENPKGLFRLQELQNFIDTFRKIQKINAQRYEFIEQINKGNYDIEDIIPVSKDDKTAIALNQLKENLKKSYKTQQEHLRHQEIETWKNVGLAKFNEILRSNINDPETLAYETISNLTDYLDAQVGAFFILTQKDGKEILELLGYYGYNRKIYEKKYFDLGEGLTGNVALEKMPTVTKVPPDYVELATGLGKAAPNYIAVYPLMALDTLYGVIEIAKIKPFEDYELDFLSNISEIIASSLATVKINQETKKLLEQSQVATAQMRQKERELENTINRLEKIQKESEEQRFKLESIISALNEIVYYAEFTPGKKVITVNKQITEKLNIPYTQATEKTYFELFNIPVVEIDRHTKYWENVLNGHKTEFTFEIVLADTSSIWVNATLIPIIKDLKIERVIFIGVDITPVKEKENTLEKLLLETKEKEERLQVQEMEMEMTLEEVTRLEKQIEEKDKKIQELENELELTQKKYQAMIKEFEKRLNRSKKIEVALREKINQLEKEIDRLKNQKD